MGWWSTRNSNSGSQREEAHTKKTKIVHGTVCESEHLEYFQARSSRDDHFRIIHLCGRRLRQNGKRGEMWAPNHLPGRVKLGKICHLKLLPGSRFWEFSQLHLSTNHVFPWSLFLEDNFLCDCSLPRYILNYILKWIVIVYSADKVPNWLEHTFVFLPHFCFPSEHPTLLIPALFFCLAADRVVFWFMRVS